MIKHIDKVCVDARMINASGIGVVINNILPVLVKHFEVSLIGNREELQIYKNKYNVSIIHTTATIYSLKILFQYPFFPKAALLWSPHFNVPIISNAKKRIVTIHDVFHLDHIKNLSLKERIFAKTFYYLSIKLSSHIFTVSYFTLNRLKCFYKIKENKITVAYLGARELSNDFNPLLKNFNESFFLYVGNLKPHKNLKFAIQAYAMLSDEIKENLKFKIVGKSKGFLNAEDNLPLIVEQLGLSNHIKFYENISDEELSFFYSQSKFLIIPSKYEGFGLPILEAFSKQTPVLCSNIEVFKEVAKDACLYFDINSLTDLKSKISFLYESLEKREELRIKGLKRLKDFSWEKCQNNYVNLIHKILKE